MRSSWFRHPIRRRPKLNRVLGAIIGCPENDVHAMLVALDEAGYMVIEKRTRRREREERSLALFRADYAESEAQYSQEWGRECAQDSRRMVERVSFLYRTAVAHGVSPAVLTPDRV